MRELLSNIDSPRPWCYHDNNLLAVNDDVVMKVKMMVVVITIW